jgi:hypothetical protein
VDLAKDPAVNGSWADAPDKSEPDALLAEFFSLSGLCFHRPQTSLSRLSQRFLARTVTTCDGPHLPPLLPIAIGDGQEGREMR